MSTPDPSTSLPAALVAPAPVPAGLGCIPGLDAVVLADEEPASCSCWR